MYLYDLWTIWHPISVSNISSAPPPVPALHSSREVVPLLCSLWEGRGDTPCRNDTHVVGPTYTASCTQHNGILGRLLLSFNSCLCSGRASDHLGWLKNPMVLPSTALNHPMWNYGNYNINMHFNIQHHTEDLLRNSILLLTWEIPLREQWGTSLRGNSIVALHFSPVPNSNPYPAPHREELHINCTGSCEPGSRCRLSNVHI